MSSWEEPGQDKEITDLDTARLALRGALSSARSLQDLNGKLKGELQEFLHREKALNERLIRLQTELNDSYSRLDKEMTSDRERADALRDTLRQEIVAEQNHKWQSEIDALRQSVQNWTEVRRQKETELKILKETLLAKEQEVFTLQKEKIASEEKAHRDVLEAIKHSRAGVTAAIDDVILAKEKEIADLQRKLAAQPKVIEERMQQIEQELHRKEQSLLLQFRDRQHALEFDWARREKELWEKATESREALERDLKKQWEERRANLEDNLEKRRLTLETQFKQQEEEERRRIKTRDEELHQTWSAKEFALAQQWAERENELAREFQKTLDLERQRASDEQAKLKAETEEWRKGQADSLRRKEDDFNKAHQTSEQTLRNAYRKKEEDLLARHQEILDAAQRQISDLMTHATEKEGLAKAAQDRLSATLKERQDIADKLARMESDAARRNAELEALIKTRDEELARLNQATTTRDESRVAALQNLERDQLLKESELKVLREKIQQAETDRKTALAHAAGLETEFTQRQQQMETAFRTETETLSTRLTALSQESAERQQTDQRLLAELTATVQQRTSEVQGLTHQLQLTRHDIEKMTQESGDKQTKHVMIRRQLEERLGAREAELNHQIAVLEKERMSIEERFEARIIELEQELARRISEDHSLQDRFRQSEEFRIDLEKQAEMLRDRLAAHEKQTLAREDDTRVAREAAELERIAAEQKLQLRIGELEATIARQAAFSTELQERLQRADNERAADQNVFETQEARLEERVKALQQQLQAQHDELQARLQSVQLEHGRIEDALRLQLKDQDAAAMKLREQLLGQVAELEGQLRRKELEVKGLKDQLIQDERTHRDYVRDANQREAALEERTQFLQKTLDTETAELQSKFEIADRAHMKAQDALRSQVLELETALNRKTAEADDLKARLAQAHSRQAELQQITAQLEARVIDREQAVRAAAQTHLQSEQKLEGALTDMQAALEKRSAEFQTSEKRLAELSKERQAETRAAAEREKQLEERLQALDEKLRTQKEQITLRLTGVERQRLQSEEALHTRTLDLEQRLAEKSGLVKTLQDQLARAGSEQEHLGKKILSLESHLMRTEQQLKGRETEYQTLLSTNQKETAATHDAHQRKVLELQGQRLTLESDLKGLQDQLAAAEQEKHHLSEKTAALESSLAQHTEESRETQGRTQKEMAERLAADVKAAEALMIRIGTLESQLMRKESAFVALEKELAQARADYDQLSSTAGADHLRLSEQQALLEAQLRQLAAEHQTRLDAVLQERLLVEKEHQRKILELDEMLGARTRALEALDHRLASSEDQRAERDRQATELHKEIKSLQLSAAAQQEEFRARMAGFEKERAQLQETQSNRITHLEGQLTHRETALRTLQEKLTLVDADRQALTLEKSAWDTRMESLLADRTKTETALHARVVNLQETLSVREKELVMLKETLQQTEQTHALMNSSSEQAVSMSVKERQALEERLVAEVGRVRDLESQLRAHAAHIKEAEKALVAGENERSALQTALTELRTRLDEEIGVRDAMTQDQVNALQGKMLSLETEWRTRLDETAKASASRVESLQEKIVALEGALGVRENDLSSLRQQIAETGLERDRLADVIVQKERNHQVLAELAERDKKEFAARLALVHAERNAAEEALQAQLKALRTSLEKQLSGEQQRAQGFETQVTAQLSELTQLRGLLAELQTERAKLLEALAQERSRSTADTKEFNGRLAAAAQDARQQLAAIQARAAELEKSLAVQRSEHEQRTAILKAEHVKSEDALEAKMTQEFNARMAALQTDHTQAEKDLHARLIGLSDTLAARVADVQRLEISLRETEQQRAALDHYSTASHAESMKRREELEQQLAGERTRAQALETQCTTQISELKQLQTALQDIRIEREELLGVLANEREKASGELKGRQKAMTEMEAALRIRFETQIKEGAARFNALQERALELERKAADKQAAVDRLQETLKELDARRAHAEAQWAEEAQVRRQSQEVAAKAQEEFAQRLAALQSGHQAAEDGLHQRLIELRNTLAARSADVQKLELQLNEAEQAHAALEQFSTAAHEDAAQRREALERELRTEREQTQALDIQLTTQVSELKQLQAAFEDARTGREQLIGALEAERARAAAALKGQEKTTGEREVAMRAQMETQDKEFRARLAAADQEAAHRLSVLQARTAELEKTLSAQRADFEQRFALSQGERAKSEKALQARISELHGQWVARSAELEAIQQELATVQKERDALAVASGDQKQAYTQQLEALRQRSLMLEHEASEAKAVMARMQDALTELESHRAHAEAQWAEEARERRAAQDAAAKAQDHFTQRLAAVQAEHQVAEQALHARLAEVRTDLDQRLNAEREKSQSLSTQLAAQLSELQQLKTSLDETRTERETLLASLAAEREKTTLELKNREGLTTEQKRKYEQRLNAQEKEFRERLAAADVEAGRQLSLLHLRAVELEKSLSTQRADFEQRFALSQGERAKSEKALQTRISELHGEWVARGAQLDAAEQRLATVQKEYEALLAASGDQKQSYAGQLEALRQRALGLEREAAEARVAMTRMKDAMAELESHRAHAEAQWADEVQARRAAQDAAAKAQDDFTQRLAAIQAEHLAAENGLHQRLVEVRTDLDQRLNAEREKNQSLSTQLSAQISELLQLRTSLEETRTEREKLLSALAAEREKVTLEQKDRESLTTEQKRKYEQRLNAQEKEFRERLAAADTEAARRLNALQARAAELEKTLAAQHSDAERQMAAQRSDYEQRLAILEAERGKAEKALQATLSDLQVQLTQRSAELHAVQDRLAMVDSQRQAWEASAASSDQDYAKERKNFEARLSEERARAAALDLALKAQTAEYVDVQDALAAARKEGAALVNRVGVLEKGMRERLEAAAQDASSRMAALQARAIELERQGAEKQAALDRLRDALAELESKRAHVEEQWAAEIKERRALQEAAAQANAQFTLRLDAVQSERAAAEQALHAQLLQLRDTLTARAAVIQTLERQLKETEQARAALEHYSTASHTEMSKAQADLTQQFRAEQERAKTLDARASAQGLELKQLRQSLLEARTEREQLLAQIAGEREKATLALKAQEKASGDDAVLHRQKAEALEKEFRERLASVNAETARRLAQMQTRATELEKSLAVQRADHEQRLATLQAERSKAEKALQIKISDIQGELIASEAELENTRQQIAALQANREAHLKASEEQKQALTQRLAALQDQSRGLRETLNARDADLKNLEQRLLEADQAHAALQQSSAASQADAARQKQELEQRLSEERGRVRELDLALKANALLIKDLKDALAGEQKQYKASSERNTAYEQRMEDLRARAAELERQGAEKQSALEHLRETLTDLEAKRGQAERQRDDLANRLAAVQAERKAAEDALHQRLLVLREELEHRVVEAQDRARGLDTQLAGQIAELKSLRGALAEEKTERERLAKALAAEREKALLELKGREKASAETTSTLWQQMQAQEKEFRAQLASIEEDAGRRVGILQARTAELEKSLAAQRSDFEQRLATLQRERSGAEEKLHAKIFSLEETLSRRIAEAQTLHAEFAAVETARSVAEESASAAHGELVRQQALFDERLGQEQAQARALEQQLQQYKSQAREWKDGLAAAKEERRTLEAAWAAEKQKIQDEARSQGLTLQETREQQEQQLEALNQEWTARLDTLSKESADRLKTLQTRLNDMDRQLAQRGLEAGELKENVAALEEERLHLQAAVAREEEAKQAAVERGAALESRLAETQRTHLQAEQKMHARLADVEDQLSRKSAALNQVEDRLELLQKANDDFEKAGARDNTAWTRQREELEKKLAVERGRLRDLEADQAAQNATLRELQEALSAAEKERQTTNDALRAQKERFLSDLALRDAGSAQRQRALELEREALEKQWQERLKSASQDTVERMEALRRRAEDLEKQLSGRSSELHELHDQVSTLEQARRTLQEKIDILSRDRKEQADAAAAERARLVERSRALEERLKEQAHDLNAQMETFERDRDKIEKALEHRLAQLQDQVAKRTADLKDAEERLHVIEESRAELEKTAGQGHSQWARERAQLEERLAAERSRAKELARQLADATTQAKDVQASLSDTRKIEKIEADWARRLEELEQRQASEIEKRVAEKLREQMMGALESGALKGGDSAAMQTLLEEWVFGFAHQVRNPLGIIRSVAESLFEAEGRRTQKDSLSAIVKAVDGLNLRLKEFIEFSKPVKPLMQSVDLPSAVAAAVRLVEEKGLPANTSVETLLPAPGTRVWMDPDHLRTILVHLLRNAAEAMPKGGHIRLDVTFDPKSDRLELRVRDEGAGIPREHLKEVGRPFFSTKPNAVGLGLALIKRLLRAYDGKLEIESKSAHATTVICRMKTRQESAGQWAA